LKKINIRQKSPIAWRRQCAAARRHILRGRPEGFADRELRFSTRKEVEAAIRRRLSSKNRAPAFTRGDQERFVIDAPQTRLIMQIRVGSLLSG
jgi:hypothetical protein